MRLLATYPISAGPKLKQSSLATVRILTNRFEMIGYLLADETHQVKVLNCVADVNEDRSSCRHRWEIVALGKKEIVKMEVLK